MILALKLLGMALLITFVVMFGIWCGVHLAKGILDEMMRDGK